MKKAVAWVSTWLMRPANRVEATQPADWECDFAVWSSIKYLNADLGESQNAFVHERYGGDENLPRFAG